MTTIEITGDEKYLADIMPIMERVEKTVYEVTDEKLADYREETQRKIIDGLWLEVHEDKEEYEPTAKSKSKK